MAQAVAADSVTMIEKLTVDLGCAPYSPSFGSVTSVSSAAVSAIASAAASDLSQDMKGQANGPSMYYAGKALAKFASIVYAANDLAKQTTLAAAGLQELEDVLNISINNTQIYPLVYDQAWKGSVSSASYVSKDPESDFGNTYYNDHHFHYGFFVYTAVTGINQHNSSVTKQPALIHMLPLNPSSSITRTFNFVQQEWNLYFSQGRADAIQGGWKGIVYANLALIDPKASYRFFAAQKLQ